MTTGHKLSPSLFCKLLLISCWTPKSLIVYPFVVNQDPRVKNLSMGALLVFIFFDILMKFGYLKKIT